MTYVFARMTIIDNITDHIDNGLVIPLHQQSEGLSVAAENAPDDPDFLIHQGVSNLQKKPLLCYTVRKEREFHIISARVARHPKPKVMEN